MFDIKNIKHNIIQVTVRGKITENDMKEMTKHYKEKIKEEEPINLSLIFEEIEGITLKGLIKDLELVKYLKSLTKLAIVGDKTWLSIDAKVENFVPGVKVKQFELNEKEKALEWLEN